MNLLRLSRGSAHPGWVALAGSVIAVAGLVVLLARRPGPPPFLPPLADGNDTAEPPRNPGELMLYCAAGLRLPVTEVAKRYQREYGVTVQTQFGGSNTLLSQLEVIRRGDLYLAAELSYFDLAREKGLVDEVIPVAYMRPVIGVQRGNPKNIRSLADLVRGDVRLAVVNPEAGALGRTLRRVLQPSGFWSQLDAAVQARGVYKPNVNDVANDVKLGSVDAAFVWDATVRQMPDLEAVAVPEFAGVKEQAAVGVLRSAADPTAALRFARYLTARDRGLEVFLANGYPEIAAGDAWELTPKITVFSGGVNRPGLEQTLAEFAGREGVEINTVYNGCGILVAQMKGIRKGEQRGGFPDAYFACDVSFMDQVREWFTDETQLTRTDMVILTQRGNPGAIHSLGDLTKGGLKVGLADPQASALGFLTKQLLLGLGLYEGVQKNVAILTPTADLLVNSMRIGSLDAAVVYRVNATAARDALEVVPIADAKAVAVQPYALARDGAHLELLHRLMQRLRSPESRQRFEAAGFQFRHAAGTP